MNVLFSGGRNKKTLPLPWRKQAGMLANRTGIFSGYTLMNAMRKNSDRKISPACVRHSMKIFLKPAS